MEKDENAPEASDVVLAEEAAPQTEEVTPQPEEAQESESQESAPTREEILAASRKENKNGDERERQELTNANSLAMSAGLLIAAIILIVSVFVKDVFPVEIILVTCGMESVQSICVGLRNRRLRKLYLTVGIIEAIAAVCLAVIWILQLCGVM